MRLETLFEKFELLADAPDAVETMREVVLRFAVQGRLSAQMPGDAPVAILCEALSTARSKQIDSGKRRIQTAFQKIDSKNRPIATPHHWAWVPLNQIGLLSGGMTPSKAKSSYWDGDVNWFSSKDIKPNDLTDSGLKITREGVEATGLQLYPPGCLFMVARSGILKRTFPVSINRVEATANQDLKVLTPFVSGLERYLQIMFRGMTDFILSSLVKTGMTVQSLKYEEFEQQPFPLPPLAEQKRIVAKVDELMALCDRLAAQQQERDARHAALARASLTRFAEAPTPANLDFLFQESYPISPADMRKAILSLAVQGKLVSQVTTDETATECFSRLGLTSTLPPLNGSLEPDESLPPSWSRVRFEDIALVAGGVTLGRKLGDRRTVTLPYLRVANVKRGEIDLNVIKEISIAEDEIERYALRENDLLMTEGGDWDKVGRAAVWNAKIPICLHQNHVFRSRMRSAEISSHWFERYFNSPDGRAYFESASKQTTNLASINMRQVRGCPVPFPPIAEQLRIVAKVDQLMAMVDKLDAQLSKAKAKSAALLDAVIHELLNPSAAIVDLTAYRAAVGCYAIRKMGGKRYFGRTAAMKVFYLAQAHVGLELGLQPMREAAGPLDPWIYRFEEQGDRNDWFKVVENTTTGGKKKIEYRPGQGIVEQSAQAESLLSADQRREFDRLLDLVANKKTDEAEIIATLFAAWNDFLIDGHTPGDDEIVTEVREHWHESKQRFTPQQLLQWLAWMRDNELVPKGKLPRTVHQTALFTG